MQFIHQIFDSSSLTPHGVCLLWRPELLWLHVASDAVIGLSYYSIPLALAWFVTRRRDIDFGWIFWLFAVFILACGTTHFLSIYTLWHPAYGIEGLVKAVTAIVSLGTAALLWPLIPKALHLPSPAALKEMNANLAQQVVEREKMVAVVRESEERFRDIYNHTPAPLSSQDERGCIIDVSHYLLKLMGYTRSEMIGRPGSAFMTPESARRMQETIWPQTLREGEIHDAEIQCVKKSGEIIDVLLSSRIERENDGSFSRTYSVLVDVTARKLAEESLAREIDERQRMKEMLHQSQKMEAVGQLTGGIAHDFNNLLTAINGNLDMLGVKTKGNEQTARLIDAANRAVQRGAGLTKQLLSFSRRQVLRPEIFNLSQRFEAMQTLLSGSLRNDIEFDVRFSEDLWPVRVDPSEFDLAVINICVNARDAMPNGGILRVTADNFSQQTPTETLELTGDYVRLSISDTGSGIAPDMMQKVFEPFFTTKEVGKGTGLGLSQVYGFARQAGGLAAIASTLGEGTTVTLYLPHSTGAAVTTPTPNKETFVHAPQSGWVLMVEDDNDVAIAAEALIEDMGYSVRRAQGPQEALSILGSPGLEFDIVFSDIVMPGQMNGIDFARKVQVLYPKLPVILTTGHSQAASSVGSEFFILPKPYNRDQLMAVFSNCR